MNGFCFPPAIRRASVHGWRGFAACLPRRGGV